MSNSLEILKLAFSQSSSGNWSVRPVRRPDLDDDPLCEYVIASHQSEMTTQYFEAAVESEELQNIHNENKANADFIRLAHNLMPEMLSSLERLQWLEHELHRASSRVILLELTLTKVSTAMQGLRDQIEQMRGLFDDEDGAIQTACMGHDQASIFISEAFKNP